MGANLPLVASVGVPVVIGAVIGFSQKNEVKGWYKTIKKPSWNPPSWLFGPVWTFLYATMGYASWLVWKAGGGPVPLGLYAAQLVANFAFSPLLFMAHSFKGAALDSTGLLGLLVATIYKFHKVDETAAKLLVPYLAWVSFATALSYKLWQLNSEEPGAKAAAAVREPAKAAGIRKEE